MTLHVRPCYLDDARELVRQWHAHHRPPVGGLFAASVAIGDDVVGVGIAGRPVSRVLDDGLTVEVTRIAVRRDVAAPNACSTLYGALRGAAKALGYRRVVTYTLASEPGTSPRAAGFRCAGPAGGGEWHEHVAVPSRGLPPLLALLGGQEPYPTEAKVRWEWP